MEFSTIAGNYLARTYNLAPYQLAPAMRESPLYFLRPYLRRGCFLDRREIEYGLRDFHDRLCAIEGVGQDTLCRVYESTRETRGEKFHQRITRYFGTLRDILEPYVAQHATAPKGVQFLLAGGTITMSGALDRHGTAGAELLARENAEMGNGVSVFGSQGVDSSVMGPQEWQKIMGAVHLHAVRQGRPGVLLHGTDTMEQTALMLSIIFNGYLPEPVIMTGAATPPDQPDSDAIENLTHACLVARNPQTPPFVYVVIGCEIHLGSRVKKVALDAKKDAPYFTSAGGPVGHIKEGKIVFKNDFLDWARHFLPRFSFDLDDFSMTFTEIAVRPDPERAFDQLLQRIHARHDHLGILVYGNEEWRELRRRAWGSCRSFEHFLAVYHPHAFFLPEQDVPIGLDPVRAALKLSLVNCGGGPSETKKLMRCDLAGEEREGYEAVFRDLDPPETLPNNVDVIYATQTMDHVSIRQAAMNLSSRAQVAATPLPEPINQLEFAAIRASHPILDAIAYAVSLGVEVVMATSAFQAATNLQEYEIGGMLALMGARDSGGMNFRRLCQEAPDHPRLIIVGTGSGHIPIGLLSREQRLANHLRQN